MSTPSFAGQIVAVTGASGGIGRASAIEFGRSGATVALIARGESGLEGAAREVEAVGGTAMVVPTDMSDNDQVVAAVDRIERELGPDRRLGQRRLHLRLREGR